MADNVTYFAALPFVPADDGVAPGEPVECGPNWSRSIADLDVRMVNPPSHSLQMSS